MKTTQKWIALALAGTMSLMLFAGCGNQTTPGSAGSTPSGSQVQSQQEAQLPEGVLIIKEQGMFSSGGTVTEPVEGEYDPTTNWLELERHGNTAHVPFFITVF